ncbi:hypothetical protein Clacol_002147 [Clathrus columnatus]|uniref:Uncharacterized protein n=1 Tax=Clathrus columnatus TaxID=1419009 RepID=A0AAV5A4K1_9AGAM|nr:hypothetical protein Clacol_002147 [Clathrus columnatus]
MSNPSTSFGQSPPHHGSLLIHPPAQAGLPSNAVASKKINTKDIQGDILVGIKKAKESFLFFQITNSNSFRSKLGKQIYSRVTSVAQLLADPSQQPTTALNIAFSQAGLTAMGIFDPIGDSDFSGGQFGAAGTLGDNTTNWDPAFTSGQVHGVLMFISNTTDNINSELNEVQSMLSDCITPIYRLDASARPGAYQGHEHFGYMDGIGQPNVDGFGAAQPGQTTVPLGTIITGETGDNTFGRPSWTVGGSFLAFRKLQQLVPEFNKFLSDNAISMPGMSQEQGAELLGARMIGRWKSGAPIDLTPLADDPVLAADPTRNNNFDFTHPGFDLTSDQSHCPFTAHIRKTNPRADINPQNIINHIVRAGIPYGDEVTADEADSNKTNALLFKVSYQSSIANGFVFQQQNWANNVAFPPGKNVSQPGFDPIVGENGGQSRVVTGLYPDNASQSLTMPMDFVISRGGEYFFSPPISALKGRLSGGFSF